MIMSMPRKPIGDRPLTLAERSARLRARRAAKESKLLAALRSIQAARTIGEARQIATSAILRDSGGAAVVTGTGGAGASGSIILTLPLDEQ
jgi:hypothetical protein